MKKRFKLIFKNKRFVFCFSIFLLAISLVFCFCSGGLSYESKVEDLSNLITENAAINELESCNIAYLGNKDSKQKMTLLSSYVANNNRPFYNTQPLQNVICFNGLKDKKTNIYELDELGEDITFIISGVWSNHKDNENRIIHNIYYFEMMFEGTDSSYTEYDNFCCISKTQADYLIAKNSLVDYESLIDSDIFISCNEQTYRWKISNIFFDNCLFTNECARLFGNYLFSYIRIPNEEDNPCEMFFSFHNDRIQNMYLTKSLLESFDILPNTISGLNVPNNIIVKFYDDLHETDDLSMILTVVSLAISFSFFFLYFSQKYYKKWKYFFYVLMLSFSLWFVFWIIWKVTKSLFLFSFYSLVLFIVFLCLFSSLHVVAFLCWRQKNDCAR